MVGFGFQSYYFFLKQHAKYITPPFRIICYIPYVLKELEFYFMGDKKEIEVRRNAKFHTCAPGGIATCINHIPRWA